VLTQLLIALIRVYQATLSRILLAAVGPVCRFEPSCSRYAVACLEGHGALRGSLLSVKRLCKCHPFHPGGFDPPPPPRSSHSSPGSANSMGPTERAPVTMGLEAPSAEPADPALIPAGRAGVP
jgi:putative membrane protein insertion efficiency factor